MFSQVNVIPWLIKWSLYKGAEPRGKVLQRGSNTDNFDELTWFLPRQEGSQWGRWGLLPDNPTLESSHSLKRQEHTCTEQQLQSKQPQNTSILHLHPGLRQPLDSSSLSHSLWYRCPFYHGNQGKQWPPGPSSVSIFNLLKEFLCQQ